MPQKTKISVPPMDDVIDRILRARERANEGHRGSSRECALILVLLLLNLLALCKFTWFTFETDSSYTMEQELYNISHPGASLLRLDPFQVDLLKTYNDGIDIWNVNSALPRYLMFASIIYLIIAVFVKSTNARHWAVASSLTASILQAFCISGLAHSYVKVPSIIAHSYQDIGRRPPPSYIAISSNLGAWLNMLSQVAHIATLLMIWKHRLSVNNSTIDSLEVSPEEVIGGRMPEDGMTKPESQEKVAPPRQRASRMEKRAMIAQRVNKPLDITVVLCSCAVLADIIAFWLAWDGRNGTRQLWERAWRFGTTTDLAMVLAPFVTMMGLHWEGGPMQQSLFYSVACLMNLWPLIDGHQLAQWRVAQGPIAAALAVIFLLSAIVMLVATHRQQLQKASLQSRPTLEFSLKTLDIVESDVVDGWTDTDNKPPALGPNEEIVRGRPLVPDNRAPGQSPKKIK